jgi:hypothetical protein
MIRIEPPIIEGWWKEGSGDARFEEKRIAAASVDTLADMGLPT